jgi:ABC-type branched-subunit amino acid transport system ATPase component
MVARGETVAVLGPNGAGKSTLMKCLSGLIRPVSGEIGFAGKALARLPAHRVARAGLILVPEGRQVFPRLTVAENLRLGATRRGDFDESEIETMLGRFPRLRPRLHTAAGLLSGGEQQMLAVARGLLARPEMLLLDEPSLGLAPAVAAELFGQLAQLREEGVTLLIVDQMADHVLAVADRGYVLGGGRVVAQGTASELRDKMLDEAYLGARPAVVS